MSRDAVDLMIDLETMGNKSNAAIVAIGAVLFTQEEGVIASFDVTVDLHSSIAAGLTLDAGTILWWLQQSDEARAAITTRKRKRLDQALLSFIDWLNQHSNGREVRPWGNGASFDIPIIENALHAANIRMPWAFWNHRCYRTFVAPLGRDFFPREEEAGTAHKALDDALYQTDRLLASAAALNITLS